MMHRPGFSLSLLLPCLLVACDSSGERPVLDASPAGSDTAADASQGQPDTTTIAPDSRMPDAFEAQADASVPDTAVPDAATTKADAAAPDTAPPEAGTVKADGSVPDTATPDAATVKADASVPDTADAATAKADASVPDTATTEAPGTATCAEAPFTHLSPLELKTLLDGGEDPFLINVKGTSIPNIPGTDAVLANDLAGIETLVKNDLCANIVLYCRSGATSESVGTQLIAKGYKRVRDLAGGITAWQAAGYPTL